MHATSFPERGKLGNAAHVLGISRVVIVIVIGGTLTSGEQEIYKLREQ